MKTSIAIFALVALFAGEATCLKCYFCQANDGNIPACGDTLDPSSPDVQQVDCPAGDICQKLKYSAFDIAFSERLCTPKEKDGKEACAAFKDQVEQSGGSLQVCETCDTELCNK